MDNNIKKRLINLIRQDFNVLRPIVEKSEPILDFGFDSLDFIELATGIEQEFNIILEPGDDDEKLSEFGTFGEIIDFVKQRQAMTLI